MNLAPDSPYYSPEQRSVLSARPDTPDDTRLAFDSDVIKECSDMSQKHDIRGTHEESGCATDDMANGHVRTSR